MPDFDALSAPAPNIFPAFHDEGIKSSAPERGSVSSESPFRDSHITEVEVKNSNFFPDEAANSIRLSLGVRDSFVSDRASEDDGPTYQADFDRASLISAASDDELRFSDVSDTRSSEGGVFTRISIASTDSDDARFSEGRASQDEGPAYSAVNNRDSIASASSDDIHLNSSRPSGGFGLGKFFGRVVKWISNAISSFQLLNFKPSFSFPHFGSYKFSSGREDVVQQSEVLNPLLNEQEPEAEPPKFVQVARFENGNPVTFQQAAEEQAAQEAAARALETTPQDSSTATPPIDKAAVAAENIKKSEVTDIQEKYASVLQKLIQYHTQNTVTGYMAKDGARLTSHITPEAQKGCQRLLQAAAQTLEKNQLNGLIVQHAAGYAQGTNKLIIATIKEGLVELQQKNKIIKQTLLDVVDGLVLQQEQKDGCRELIATISDPLETRIESALQSLDAALKTLENFPDDVVEKALHLYLGATIGGAVIKAQDAVSKNVLDVVMGNIVNPIMGLIPSSYLKSVEEAASFAGEVAGS